MGAGNVGDDGFEEGEEIAGIIADLAMGDAGARVGVDDGKIELIFGGVEIDEEVVDFVEDFFGTRVGAVDFVEDDDRGKLGGERFLQDVAGLRERAFAGVHEKDDAIDHAEGAFDFAAEIAVAGRVHDIDFGVVEKEGGIFGEDGDAALALEVVGVHDALDDGFDWRGRCRIWRSMVSTRVVLPWSTWAMMAMLRILLFIFVKAS